MKRREFVGLVPLAALWAACSSDGPGGPGNPPPPPPPPPPPVGGADVTVQIVDNAFVDPLGRRNANASVTVGVGQIVGWRNNGVVQHTVTSTSVPAGGAAFDSGDLNPGGTFLVTFNAVGTYVYRCDNHPNEMLNARVIVQ